MPDNVLDLFRLDGRVAVVTGGSRGLGKEMARALAQAGARVVICSRNENACTAAAEDLKAATGGEVLAVRADVTKENDVAQLFRRVLDEYSRIDVLVNNAGINIRHPIEGLSPDEFQQIIDINLRGTWLCCRAVSRIMKEQKAGSVINIGSALSAVGLAERTAYCASKAGVLGLTRTLALEWAPWNVRCNAICPGPFKTEINVPILNDPEKSQAVVGQTAFKRWGELHEIWGAVLFLASDASTYVTGSALFADGGLTAA